MSPRSVWRALWCRYQRRSWIMTGGSLWVGGAAFQDEEISLGLQFPVLCVSMGSDLEFWVWSFAAFWVCCCDEKGRGIDWKSRTQMSSLLPTPPCSFSHAYLYPGIKLIVGEARAEGSRTFKDLVFGLEWDCWRCHRA
ncbi:hypothetical protein VTJ04DRAFT_1423 [Mycothermus thermophilus]|uniref:uncharacterized protein n=1 Tax=Humicola insolens TaxID=85995 RepID=UPI00374353B0